MQNTKRKHILTVNLEDYFQTASLGSVVLLKHWDRLERRVESNTLATMSLLEEFGLKATFFVSGWIADRLPQLIHEVAKRGHEIASRGYYQRPLARMSPEEFRKDAVRSRIALERACEHEVVGYRVARGWFSLRDLWALDILAEEGFAYDSSLRPLGAGWAGKSEQRRVFRHPAAAGDIWEFPISSWQFAGFCLPISGGNYVRQLPHGWIRRRIESWDRTSPAPLIFYFHVWELDPALPQINAASRLSKIRQYRNLDVMTQRLRHYLGSFSYQTVTDYLAADPRSSDLAAAVARRRALLSTSRAASAGPVASVNGEAPHEAAAEREPAPVAGNPIPVSIVVPCYNEEDTLTYLANTLQSFERRHRGSYRLHYIFVDDGSKDNTLATLREIFGGWQNCKIVSHGTNRGVAAATLTGIANAGTEKVCVIDCDCSYDPEILARMIPMLREDVDLVTASPYHKDGQVINVPGWRLFLSRGLSVLYGLVLNNKLATYTACVRVYRRSSLTGLVIQNEGYFGIAEILQRMDRRGARIVECPAILEARLLGVSKMKVIKTIGGHCKLLFASLVYRLRPKRKPDPAAKTPRTHRDGVKEDERVGC